MSTQDALPDSAARIELAKLAPGSRIELETKSRHYHIECLGGNTVRISGHPDICPEPVAARIHGSIDREGVLESGQIGQGMRLMFVLEDNRPVTTSRVLSLHINVPPRTAITTVH